MVIDLTPMWIPNRVYRFRDVVTWADQFWCATRGTKGEMPGWGDAWMKLRDPGTPKADLAESLDNRIGRGL